MREDSSPRVDSSVTTHTDKYAILRISLFSICKQKAISIPVFRWKNGSRDDAPLIGTEMSE